MREEDTGETRQENDSAAPSDLEATECRWVCKLRMLPCWPSASKEAGSRVLIPTIPSDYSLPATSMRKTTNASRDPPERNTALQHLGFGLMRPALDI